MVKNIKFYISDFLKKNQASYRLHFEEKGTTPLINFTGKKIIKNVEKVARLVPEDLTQKNYPLDPNFDTHLNAVLSDTLNSEIANYFHYAYGNSGIFYSTTYIPTASFEFVGEQNNIGSMIYLSPYDGTNNYAVELMHELSHFYDFYNRYYGRKFEPYELSEVIPIFFEYMMYMKTSPNGYDDFIRNKAYDVFSFGSLKDFFKISDLENEDKERFKYLLAREIQYICGFNYAIQLIERRNQDKSLVDQELGHVLNGRKNSLDMAEKLDINVSNFKPMKKVMRKRMYRKWEQ